MTNASDVTWWKVTLGHLGQVIEQISAFASLPSFDLSVLDLDNLQADLLIYMQKFLFDNGPEAIARRLVYIWFNYQKIYIYYK